LDTVWTRLDYFRQARLKLTALYVFVLFIILNIFTVSLFLVLQHEEKEHINKVELELHEEKVFFPGNDITIIEFNKSPQNFGKDEFLDLQHDFLKIIKQWILIIESFLLFLTGILSWFLSGKTLLPIQKKNEQEKQFLADVSHELKNPLSAIKMTVDVSKKQKNWKKWEINEIFSDIDTEISRLITITEDLLILEKAQSTSTPSKVDIKSLITTVSKKCNVFAKIKNIELILNISPFSTILIKKDLEKVIFNILHNSIKFSHPNSKIAISLSQKGKIEIKDNGIGISKKECSKIFDRFYKAENARTFRCENGSGLGLSIVKKICDRNKWHISIFSRKNKETIVTINLSKIN